MNWSNYSSKFISQAKVERISDERIENLLTYAKNLHKKKIPIIFDLNHLSNLVGYSFDYIERAIKYTRYFYRYYEIPKKNGKLRSISEPLPSLKEIQKWILKEILYTCKVSKYAKAYVKNRSIKSNAYFHQNKKIVLTIDISDFFGSIKQEKIDDFFQSLGYSNHVSLALSKLCTLNGSLPQGAPTSPYLSNLLFLELDLEISDFCRRNNISYTRYSDDLTFSGDENVAGVINFVNPLFTKYDLYINPDKTRTRRKNECQEVTGIVVNKKLQVSKVTRKKFRQEAFYIRKYGLESHLNYVSNKKKNSIQHLIGVGNFITYINPQDFTARNDLGFLKSLYKDIRNAL